VPPDHRLGPAKGLSAAIIVQNEAAQIPGLLASLDWLQEIVIVDGGSTDRTVDLCWRAKQKDNRVRIFERAFDDFARQRNFAIDQCRHDWVLSIDADERPTPELIRAIQSLATTEHAGFRIPIKSHIFGRPVHYGGTQNDRPIRLFRRDAARWQGDVHEVLAVDGAIGSLKSALTHETLPDLDAFLRKMHHYTTLEAERRLAHSQPPRWRDTYLQPAREVFRRFIWKRGFLDGSNGWAFCLLSGLSEAVLARKHRRMWSGRSDC
jgi:glycosyltransferase involved in cell wall biosynthesis